MHITLFCVRLEYHIACIVSHVVFPLESLSMNDITSFYTSESHACKHSDISTLFPWPFKLYIIEKSEHDGYNMTGAMRRIRGTIVSGKAAILCIVSVFVALGIQHAMRMRRIILSSVTSLCQGL